MIAPNYPPEKQKSAMPKRPNVIWVLADQLLPADSTEAYASPAL